MVGRTAQDCSARRTTGQVTVEAAVLFGAIVAGLVALAIYLQRGVQGGMKSNADSLGSQFSATEAWEVHTKSTSRETQTQILSAQKSQNCQGLGGTTLATADCPTLTDPVLPGTPPATGP